MNEKQYRALINRQRRLPGMLQAARQRVVHLEREAARYGMDELLTDPRHLDAAWDREVELAWLRHEERERPEP